MADDHKAGIITIATTYLRPFPSGELAPGFVAEWRRTPAGFRAAYGGKLRCFSSEGPACSSSAGSRSPATRAVR